MADTLVKLPRDIRIPGVLKTHRVLARIISMEPRALNQTASSDGASSQRTHSQPKGNAGHGKTKKSKSKGTRSDTVLEVYICGGTTPADVMLLEVWDEGMRRQFQSQAAKGDTVEIRNVLVVAITDKTRWYTTSRSPMYLKALPETMIQRAQDKPEFLAYHPLTPIPSLPLLLPRSLVCIAGRVIEKSSVQRVDTPDGQKSVPVAHLTLRCLDDVVRINFWRETTGLIEALQTGGFIYLQGVAKQWPRGDVDPAQFVELRAVPRTKVESCPPAIEETLADTPLVSAGANDWSPRPNMVDGRPKKDYSNEPATWMSLSILDSVCASGQIRDINEVFQVPSIFLEFGSSLTYYGCSKCSKAWREDFTMRLRCNPPCIVAGQTRPQGLHGAAPGHMLRGLRERRRRIQGGHRKFFPPCS